MRWCSPNLTEKSNKNLNLQVQLSELTSQFNEIQRYSLLIKDSIQCSLQTYREANRF